MAWMNRNALVSVLVLGAAASIWSCTSTNPITTDPNAMSGGASGTGMGTGTGGTTTSGGSGSNCIPGLPCGGSPGTGGAAAAGTGGTGVVAGSGPSTGGSTGGSTPGVGGSDPATGGTGVTAGTGTGATGGTAGSETAGTGGTGGTATLGSIQVSAGDKARDHSVVQFSFPAGVDKNVVLKDSAGNQLPLQVDADGKATFVLPSLAAGADVTYKVEEVAAPLPPGIAPSQGDDQQLHIKQGDTARFRWMLVPDNFANKPANDVRAGYIYPLYTPGGVQVAGDYGEDHPHMHGLWSAWTLTTFRGDKVDFWNGYDNSGHVDLEEVTRAWAGPVHAGLAANIKHEAIKYNPRVKVMHETWVVTVYKTHEDATAPYYIFDIDSSQNVVTPEPLVIEEYHYGGFGYRGHIAWDGARGSVLTSEGLTRSNGADGSRAKWCASYGPIEGKVGGFAGLSHPTNFRHPQGLRVHPTNPFWSFTPVTASGGGRTTFEPGTPFVSKYRVVVFDGAADAALINRLWDDFATPPTVTVLP